MNNKLNIIIDINIILNNLRTVLLLKLKLIFIEYIIKCMLSAIYLIFILNSIQI